MTVTSWGGEFLRRVAPQTNDGSGGRRQHLWKMVATQWRTIGIVPFKGEEGWRYWEGVLGLVG
jgi:hypothetical protein